MSGYCINLRNENDKFIETSKELSKLNTELIRFEVDIELYPRIIKPGVNRYSKLNSILNSHLKLLKHLNTLTEEYYLILEDNVIVLQDVDIQTVVTSAPIDWDVIYLGGLNHFSQPNSFNENFYKPKFSFNAHAYIVKATFLETLINRVELRDFEIDVIFAHMQSNNIGNWYATSTDYIIQNGKYSLTTITTFGDNLQKIRNLKNKGIILKEIMPMTIISKKEIFEDICKKQLKYIENKWPLIDKNSKLKSLIIESRFNDQVEFTIKNTIQKLGDGWGHIIVCTDNNIDEIEKLVNEISAEIEIINLEKFIITRNTYNNLCLDIQFWEKIECEKVLVYQSDTYIFKEFDNSFLEFDYIGAAWGPSIHSLTTRETFSLEKEIFVGNGGLSLRTLSAMKTILKDENKPLIRYNAKIDCDQIWEDLFFSYYIELSNEYKLAPIEVAQKFSFEHFYSDDTFGCHQPYLDSFSGEDNFKKFLDRIGGVNALGFGNTNIGLGHNMRTIIEALKLAKIPYNIRTEKIGKLENYLQDDQFNYFNTNLILCNPDHDFKQNAGNDYLNNKYNIALWAWEMENVTDKWIKSSEEYDEIWTISEFCKNAFEKNLPSKPIASLNIPAHFKNRMDKADCKKELNFENKFVILFIFDANSDLERKNPKGVIESFKMSLSNHDNCILILKAHNMTDEQMFEMSQCIDDKNIMLINENWSYEKMEVLFNSADIYISLHRSEGSGLTMMEAIMLEIPLICTGYSGNLDFCQADHCELVEFEMVKVGTYKCSGSFYDKLFKKSELPYWANPSIIDAADKLLKIYRNYDKYTELIKLNKEFIEKKYNIQNLSGVIRRLLNR
jgi:hypothetical protein